MFKTYCCEKCVYRTAVRSCYTAHLKTKKHTTPIVESAHKCENCGKHYKSIGGIRRHRLKNGDNCRPLYGEEAMKKWGIQLTETGGVVGGVVGGVAEGNGNIQTMATTSKNLFMELFDIIESHKQGEFGYVRPLFHPPL